MNEPCRPLKPKKPTCRQYPKVCLHVGLLIIKPPGRSNRGPAELLLSSHPKEERSFVPLPLILTRGNRKTRAHGLTGAAASVMLKTAYDWPGHPSPGGCRRSQPAGIIFFGEGSAWVIRNPSLARNWPSATASTVTPTCLPRPHRCQ